MIVSAPGTRWVEPTAQRLRDQDVAVVLLEAPATAAFVLLCETVAAVVVDEARVPRCWPAIRDELTQISPRTRILVIANDDTSTPDQLVHRIRTP